MRWSRCSPNRVLRKEHRGADVRYALWRAAKASEAARAGTPTGKVSPYMILRAFSKQCSLPSMALLPPPSIRVFASHRAARCPCFQTGRLQARRTFAVASEGGPSCETRRGRPRS